MLKHLYNVQAIRARRTTTDSVCWRTGSGVDEKQSVRRRWHAMKPHPAKDAFHPAGSTDVTQREGRSLADYYGVYTLIGLQQ